MKRSSLFLILATCCLIMICNVNSKDDPPGMNTGIQVHGHWIIEILNPDGSSAGVHEFDNSLYEPNTLTAVLTREPGFASYGGWVIELNGAPQPCGAMNTCKIAQPAYTPCEGTTYHSSNLAVSRSGVKNETIHLSGSVIAVVNSNITSVFTQLKLCNNSVLPTDCPGTTYNCVLQSLTMKNVAISVVAGQQILVNIDITFS